MPHHSPGERPVEACFQGLSTPGVLGGGVELDEPLTGTHAPFSPDPGELAAVALTAESASRVPEYEKLQAMGSPYRAS